MRVLRDIAPLGSDSLFECRLPSGVIETFASHTLRKVGSQAIAQRHEEANSKVRVGLPSKNLLACLGLGAAANPAVTEESAPLEKISNGPSKEISSSSSLLKGKHPVVRPSRPSKNRFAGINAAVVAAAVAALASPAAAMEVKAVPVQGLGFAQPSVSQVGDCTVGAQWMEGDQVFVDASDLPKSLKQFDGRSGVVQEVGVANCLVRFDSGEEMYILHRGLRKQDRNS